MRALSSQHFASITEHLQGDASTLRIAFKGGHRETLILVQEPGSDGLISGETHDGNRIEFDMKDVASVTYIQQDEEVMTEPDVQAYKPNLTPASPFDGPVKVWLRRNKSAVTAEARQGDEGLGKA